jgi:O-antigen/teichoic acid export membrane protein
LLNLLGLGVPLLVALLCLPVMVPALGAERFGVLALAWGVMGFAGAFDLGIARAATRSIASAVGRGAPDEVPRILGTALLTDAGLGSVGGALIVLAGPILAREVFQLPAGLREEAAATLQGLGRPDLHATLDVVDAALLLGLLLVLVPERGLVGAAVARMIIAAVELGGLLVLTLRASRLAPVDPLLDTVVITGGRRAIRQDSV